MDDRTVAMMVCMSDFSVDQEQIDLPRGAFFKSARTFVQWQGRTVIGLGQNDHRAYLYPVLTPAGFPLTTESPVDHPHHNSVWVGADHVTALLPFDDDRYEEATYSFYINETFQGRAPGRIVSRSIEHEERSENHLRLVQTLDWQGPVEWGAPAGRTIAVETRTFDVRPGKTLHAIDIASRLSPTEWDLRIGPTRHAWFGIRVAEPLRPGLGGIKTLSKGDWVHLGGEFAAGHRAGLAVCRSPELAGEPWSIHDWGTIDVNPLVQQPCELSPGDSLVVSIRLLAHDGPLDEASISDQYRRFVETGAPS